MDGTVVIGEGEKDQAPMLFNGEQVGSGSGSPVDVAVDPLEGTELAALALPNAVSAIAVAERGTIFAPTQAYYMEKIVTGPDAADAISLDAGPSFSSNLFFISPRSQASMIISPVTPRHY